MLLQIGSSCVLFPWSNGNECENGHGETVGDNKRRKQTNTVIAENIALEKESKNYVLRVPIECD